MDAKTYDKIGDVCLEISFTCTQLNKLANAFEQSGNEKAGKLIRYRAETIHKNSETILAMVQEYYYQGERDE